MEKRLELSVKNSPPHLLIPLTQAIVGVLPKTAVISVQVMHDTGCPCETGKQPISACTCEAVNYNFMTSQEP